MKRIVFGKIVCLMLAGGSVVFAAEPAALLTVLTIDQLVQTSLRHNAELAAYEAALAAAKGERRQAGLWNNPEFSGEYGSRRVTDSGGALQGDGFTRGFSLTQTFEFPGKGTLRKAIADQNTRLAELGLRQFRRALTLKIRALALRLIAADADREAAAEVSERCAALVKLLRERPPAGVPQLLELRAIEGALVELQQAAREAAMVSEETRLELNSLLGFPASQPLMVSAELAPPVSVSVAPDELVARGLTNNLQLKMRAAEVAREARQISAAKLAAAPDFSVGPFFSQDRADGREENFGVALTVTLPLWNWNQGGIESARAGQARADALLLDARRQVAAAITRCHRALALGQKQLAQLPPLTVSELRAAADLADRQYRTGAIGAALFLEVQRQFLNTQKIRHRAVLDVWNNRLDLDLLTGAEEDQ